MTQLKSLVLLLFLGVITCLSINCDDGFVAVEENSPVIPKDTCFLTFLKIDGTLCALDASSNTFYYPLSALEMAFKPMIEYGEDNVVLTYNNQVIVNKSNYDFGVVKVNTTLNLQVKTCDGNSTDYELIFTSLPVVQIATNANEVILDDPKITVNFQLQDPKHLQRGLSESTFVGYAGIETRGGSALGFDKKSYSLELKEDDLGRDELSESLLGMREDDDWILDAMFIDPARMRNRVSTDIWLDFQKLYYQDKELKGESATEGELVELFLNNDYQGVYMLTERIDRKQLKIKKFKEDKEYGFLYKAVAWSAAVTFKSYTEFDPTKDTWEGWEQKFPDSEDDGIFWEPLANFTQFVTESTDEDFIANIENELRIDNAVNYYIFMNLLRADDNTGKNLYLAKYKISEPFFIVPWDLDATWGLFWDQTRVNPNIVLSNHLFDRLIRTNAGDFRTRLKERWQSARNGMLTKEKLLQYFQNYATQMEESGAFERERERWAVSNTLAEEMTFIEGWIEEQLVFMDGYYMGL